MDDKCENINYPTYYKNISKGFFPLASEIDNKTINWDTENEDVNLNVQDYNEFELKSVEYYLDHNYSENVKKISIPSVKRLHSSVIPYDLDPRRIRQCMRECLEELLSKINKYPAIGDSERSFDNDCVQQLLKRQSPTQSVTTIDSNTGQLCQISVETLRKANSKTTTIVTELLGINEELPGVDEKHCDEFKRRSSDVEDYKSFDAPVKKNNESLKKYPELIADAVGSPINTSIPLKKNLKLGYSFSKFTCSQAQHEKLSQVQCNVVEENDDYEPLNTVINASIKETWALKKIYSHKKYKTNKENNFFISNENVSDLSEHPTEAEDSTDDRMTDRETRVGTVKCHRISRVSNQEPEKNYRSSIEEKRDRVSGKLKKIELRQLNKQTDNNTTVRNLKKQLSKDKINTINIKENDVYDASSPKSPIKRKQHKEFETDVSKKRKKHRSSPESSLDEASPSKEYQMQKKNIQEKEYNKSSSSNSSKNKKHDKKSTHYKPNKHERRKKYDRLHSPSPPSSSLISSSEETSPKNKLDITDKRKKNSNAKNSKQKIDYLYNEAVSNEKKNNDKHLSKRRKQEKIFNQRSSIDSGIGCATPSREVPEDSEKEELDPEDNNDNYEKIPKNSDRYSKLSKKSALLNVSLDKENLEQLKKKRQILKEQIKLTNNNEGSIKKKLPSLPFISDDSSDEDDNSTENVGSVKDPIYSPDEICGDDMSAIIESESQKQRKLEIAKRSEEDAKRVIASIVDYSSSEESISSRMISLRENISDTLDTSSKTNKINIDKNNHLDKTKDHTAVANHQAKVNDHMTGVNDCKTEVNDYTTEVSDHTNQTNDYLNKTNHQYGEKMTVKSLINQEISENKTGKAVNQLYLSTKDSLTDKTLPSKSSYTLHPTESDVPSMAQSEMKVLSTKQLWIEDVKNHPTFLEKLADIVLTSNNNCQKEQNDFPNLEKFADILFTNSNNNNSNNNKGKNDFLNSTEFKQKIRVLNSEELGCKYKCTSPAPIHAEFDEKALDQIPTIGLQIVEPIQNTEVKEKEVNHEKSQDQSCSSEVPTAPVDLSAEKKLMDKQNENNNSCTPFIYNNINIINMTCSASTAIISSASTTVTSSILTPTILNNSGTNVILTHSLLPTSIPLHTEIRVPESVSTLIAPKDTQVPTSSAGNSQSQKLVTTGLNSHQISFPGTESNFRPNMPIPFPTAQQKTPTASELPSTGPVMQSTLRNDTGKISQSVSHTPMNVIQTQVSKSFSPSTFAAQPENSINLTTPLVAGQLPSNQLSASTPTMKPPPPYSYPCSCEQCYQQNSSSNSRINPQMHEQYNVSHHQNSTTIESLYRSIVKNILFMRNMIIEFDKNPNFVNNRQQRTLFENDLFQVVMIIVNRANRLKESLNLQHWDVLWKNIIAFSANLNDERYIIRSEDIEKVLRTHRFYQIQRDQILQQDLKRIKNPAQFNRTFQSSHPSSEKMLQGQYGSIPESSGKVSHVPVPHSELNQNQQAYAQPTKAQSQQLNASQIIMAQSQEMTQNQQSYAQPINASLQQLNTSQIMMTQPPEMNQNQQSYAQPINASPQQLNTSQIMMAQIPGMNQNQQAYNQPINASPQQLNTSQIMMTKPPEMNQNQQSYNQSINASPQQLNTSQIMMAQTPGMNQNQQAYNQPINASPQQLNTSQIMMTKPPEMNQNQQSYNQSINASPQQLNTSQIMMTKPPEMNQNQQSYNQSINASPQQLNTSQIMMAQTPGMNQNQQAYAQFMAFSQTASTAIQQKQPNAVQRPIILTPPTTIDGNQQFYVKPKIAILQQSNTVQITPPAPIMSSEVKQNSSPYLAQIAAMPNKFFIHQGTPTVALSQSHKHQKAYVQSRSSSTQRVTIPDQSNNIPAVLSPNMNLYQQTSPQFRSSPKIAPPSQPPFNTVQATLESVQPPETIKYQENYEQPISLSQMLPSPQLNTTQTVLATMLLSNGIPNQQVHSQYKSSLEMSSTSQQPMPVSAVSNYSQPSQPLFSQLSHETGTMVSKPKKTRARKTIPTKKNRVPPQVVEKTQNTVEEVLETMPESIRIELEKYRVNFAEQTKQNNLAHDSQKDQSSSIESNMMQQINEKNVSKSHENMSQMKNKENVNESVKMTETIQLSVYLSNFHEKGSNNQIRFEDSSKTLSINENSVLSPTQIHQTENGTTSNIEVTDNRQNNKPTGCMISDAIEYLLVREENENSRKPKKSPTKRTEKTKNSSSPQKPREKLSLDACHNESESKVDPSKSLEASKVRIQGSSTKNQKNTEINVSNNEKPTSTAVFLESVDNEHDKNKENKSNDNSKSSKKNSETGAQENIDFNNEAQDSSLVASCQRNEIDKNIKKEKIAQNNSAEDNVLEDIHRCLTPNITKSNSNDIITIDDEAEVVSSQKIIFKQEYIKHEIDLRDEIIDMRFLEDIEPCRGLKELSDIKNINMNINKNLTTQRMNLSAKGNNLPENSVITLDDDDDEVDRVSKISSDGKTVKIDLSEDDIIIEKEKIVLESYTYTNKCIDEEIECINLINRTVEENSSTPSPETMDSDLPMNPIISAITSISSRIFDINTSATETNQVDDDIIDVTNVKIESEDEYFIT